MRSKYLRTRIWAMDPGMTFESIQQLQRMDYFESIDYLKDRSDIEKNDRMLMHRWEFDPKIKEYILNQDEKKIVRYYTATAIYEKAAPKNQAFSDENYKYPLARSKRVAEIEAGTIFVEIGGRIYCIVYGTTQSFHIRTILMGAGTKKRKRSEWGKIDQSPANFNLESDFFYWLFDKYNRVQNVSTSYGNIEIRDVERIGRFSDRQQHNTKAVGPNTIKELSNKTALGINQEVYESEFNLTSYLADMYVNLGEENLVDLNRTVIIKDNQLLSVIESPVEFLLHLYLEIIPGLRQSYNSEKANGNWTPDADNQARKKYALEVIEELCLFHDVTLDEIVNNTRIK